jgi:predicted nucleic acid-binding protein
MVIAAIARANDCIFVTDNEKHFPSLRSTSRSRESTGKRSRNLLD